MVRILPFSRVNPVMSTGVPMRRRTMNNTPFIAMLTAVLLTTGVDAFAQTSIEERVFVNASVGMQTLSPSFSYRDTQTIFLEEASAQLDVEGENDLVFDIGGGGGPVPAFRLGGGGLGVH